MCSVSFFRLVFWDNVNLLLFRLEFWDTLIYFYFLIAGGAVIRSSRTIRRSERPKDNGGYSSYTILNAFYNDRSKIPQRSPWKIYHRGDFVDAWRPKSHNR